jgi:hypothetical protein
MSSLKEQYTELIALTKVFLLRNFSLKESSMTMPKDHLFFKKWILQPSHSQQTENPSDRQSLSSPPPLSPIKKSEHVQQPILSNSFSPPTSPKPVTELTQVKNHTQENRVIDSKISPTKEKAKESPFYLDPLDPPPPSDCLEFKKIFTEYFPHYPLIDQIPTDQIAKKMKSMWKTNLNLFPILILSFTEKEKELQFLKNLAQAITLHFAPAQVISGIKIEQEKKWDQWLKKSDRRLVMASDHGFYLMPELMKSYQEGPRQGKYSLNQIPLLLLSDVSLYLSQPQLKPLLWRAICAELQDGKILQSKSI